MDKINLEIVGLSYSQTQTGAYALVLGESEGKKRRLPIIIGGFEAQAIAIELEKMVPTRPLTHDLFKSFSDAFDIKINEVIIYDLREGIFYAKLISEKDGVIAEIETRTSDAIAIAVRFGCPIYTYEFILSNAGIVIDDSQKDPTQEIERQIGEIENQLNKPVQSSPKAKGRKDMTIDELKKLLQIAIDNEDYEEASKIQQEIAKRKTK
ncbi:MAG: bifunctional nuclease family protein [Flavobacteriales bacterium]|nr:bifunctional nuclease family protein [Flavobacteriales bacterium]